MQNMDSYLVAGLGNPGSTYLKTRHNVGFMILEALANHHSIPLSKQKFDCLFGRGSLTGFKAVLAEPLAYMNRSGPPLQKLSQYFDVPFSNLLVIHDDIDLDFGRLKIKTGGGHGGHNGIRSIMGAFGGGDFTRIRVGVGRPDSAAAVTGHVLGKFSKAESRPLEELIERAVDAVETILVDGTAVAMNRFH